MIYKYILIYFNIKMDYHNYEHNRRRSYDFAHHVNNHHDRYRQRYSRDHGYHRHYDGFYRKRYFNHRDNGLVKEPCYRNFNHHSYRRQRPIMVRHLLIFYLILNILSLIIIPEDTMIIIKIETDIIIMKEEGITIWNIITDIMKKRIIPIPNILPIKEQQDIQNPPLEKVEAETILLIPKEDSVIQRVIPVTQKEAILSHTQSPIPINILPLNLQTPFKAISLKKATLIII